ncbi:MAG: DotA/TraY family protein [Gammaproteobacteria bacterium]|nr:DotA/TraY family protein [Gammaproteobacteria bacterium]
MRSSIKYLIISCLSLLPSLLYAQGAADTISSNTAAIFYLPPGDPSLNFLGQLFGNVGSVLSGSSGMILGILFKYFNLGILVIAGVFLIWTTAKVVIHSSHEGTFMGREVNTGFHIIRTVLGIGLLSPTVGGYSIIQIIVMWAVLQGAGFANTVWNQALDYFERGGQIFVPPSTNLAPLITMTGTVLESQVCMYYHEKMEKELQKEARQKIASGDTSPIYQARVLNFPSYQPYVDPNNPRILFPANRGNGQTDNGCGEFSYGQPTATNNPVVLNALVAVMQQLSGAARRIADPYPSDLTSNPSPLQDLVQTQLVNAAQNWVNYLLPIRAAATSPTTMDAFWARARLDGWMYAGSYYYQLSGIQRTINDAGTIKFQLVSPDAYCIPAIGNYINFPSSGPLSLKSQCIKNWNTYYANSINSPAFDIVLNRASPYVTGAIALANQVQAANANVVIPNSFNMGDMGELAGPMGMLSGLVLSSIQTLVSNGDPIMKLQKLGHTWVDQAVAAWIGLAMLMFFVSLLASLMSSISSAGYAFQGMMQIFVTLFMALLFILMVQGVLVSIYVPLIPFIIYTFTVIGWFIAVIEAMVAAPLVALGVTHPEGQGMLGKGEQAIMLLLGVFLRPALMVMGLLAGMLLSVIALTIFNKPFVTVLFTAVGAGGLGGFGAYYGILSLYSVLVTQIVTQSYSLIFNVPDRVLRWLGQQVESSAAGQALQAAESETKSGAEKTTSGMTMPSAGGGGGGGGGGGEGGAGGE